jgi:predicted AAA+ superfamily ATPase
MVRRKFWLKKIADGLDKRSVLWMSGVRRAGKTILCKSFPDVEYFDCELPRVRRMMEDPQSFLEEIKARTVVLDEVHRLPNPAEILKIAADHYPESRIIATGSSTLGASVKFKDTLAGRKSELWLTPMIAEDLKDFSRTDLPHRFLSGGLPPFFMSKRFPERDFQEWMDAFWAKDIMELFRLERRHSLLKFAELLMIQSGGIFEASSFAGPCEVSRSTISNYLAVLEATYVVHVIRPFTSHRPTEIVSAPKVYAFDTGFVCYYRGWDKLRLDDMGTLWEHFVLNEMMARTQSRKIYYWRDKQKHEVDFIVTKNQSEPMVIECKWTTADFDPANVKIFRRLYPKGLNFVVASDVKRSYSRNYDDVIVKFVDLEGLIKGLGILD